MEGDEMASETKLILALLAQQVGKAKSVKEAYNSIVKAYNAVGEATNVEGMQLPSYEDFLIALDEEQS